ncbi:hypothetical protein Cgig2_009770 [Carnegiea gigantea]|uniref:DUF4283 domain-containing protein n=1 Tax=Carnegiea gigantea TaxID=171969 RepID=A0A9Q1JXA0_9CARY|nr:hypothetical protein Cgig2_009770 [Carnegiea gigantea]
MDSSTSQHKDQQAEAIEATIATTEAAIEEQLDATVSPETPHLQNTQVLPRSTYASMVDLNKGARLEFIPSSLINGVKCAKVELNDAKDEIDYWQQAVLCSVLGANPPFAVMQGFIQRIWSAYGLDKIIQVRKWVFLVRFMHMQDKLTVEKKGLYYFDSKPFLFKGWNPEMDLHTESIKSFPLWVQLPDLDVKYWGQSSLSKMGSIIGIPIKTDKYTRDRTIKYARLLIEVNLEGPFPEFVEFINENGKQVKFEWLPTKCNHCLMYGYEETFCRKKERVRKEWRPIPREETTALATTPLPLVSQPRNPKVEFTPVTRRAATTHSPIAIGLLKTKVKEHNTNKVAATVFPGWHWHTNFSLNPKGRI